MQDFFTIFEVGAFGLGLIFGSFLNALSFRFNTGGGFFKEMSGRSRCMRCSHPLGALDLVPVVSYLFLKGRCRYCGTEISLQYPVVEATAGLLSLGIFFSYSGSPLLYAFWLLVWMTILFIVVYDARHMIIPWSASLFLLALSVLYLLVGFFMGQVGGINLLAGPILALPLFLFSLVSSGKWMGWADSLFELSLGSLLGLSMGATALLLGIWSGAIIGVALLLFQRLITPTATSRKSSRRFTMKSEIPFAPYLALGAAIVFFFHVDFFTTISLL